MICTPLPGNSSSNTEVNLRPRSRIRNLNWPARSPRSIRMLRALLGGGPRTGAVCCDVQDMYPPDADLHHENMYRRLRNTVSTCRKSHARTPAAWEARNCRRVGDARRGAGVSPATARIRRIVARRCGTRGREAHPGYGGVSTAGSAWPAARRAHGSPPGCSSASRLRHSRAALTSSCQKLNLDAAVLETWGRQLLLLC
jgi:hypothetical protein